MFGLWGSGGCGLPTVDGERLTGAAMMVRHLQGLGALRDGVTVEEAVDAIWMLNSVEVWTLLVEQRGWTGEQYAAGSGGPWPTRSSRNPHAETPTAAAPSLGSKDVSEHHGVAGAGAAGQ